MMLIFFSSFPLLSGPSSVLNSLHFFKNSLSLENSELNSITRSDIVFFFDFLFDKFETPNYTPQCYLTELLNLIEKKRKKMPQNNIHEPLTLALKLFNLTLKEWSGNLVKPDGTKGVSSSMVIRSAQGREESDWLRSEIEAVITKAHQTFPDYYAYHSREKVKAES